MGHQSTKIIKNKNGLPLINCSEVITTYTRFRLKSCKGVNKLKLYIITMVSSLSISGVLQYLLENFVRFSDLCSAIKAMIQRSPGFVQICVRVLPH